MSISKPKKCDKRKTSDDYHELAKARGFKWVGPVVKNVMTKTRWQCKQGHVWEAMFSKIQSGRGCPYCAGKIPKSPDDYHALAAECGYTWLGPEVRTVHIKTNWLCQAGHKWEGTYAYLQQGQGCRICGSKSRAEVTRKKPKDYHALAESRGFQWLGPIVQNNKTSTTWQCEHGHKWESPYTDIQQGNGCRKCYNDQVGDRTRKLSEDYHQLAQLNNLRWLGPMVAKINTKTTWQCPAGHKFKMKYNSIQQGQSCPTCQISKGERRIAKHLTSAGIKFSRQKRFETCRDKKHLPFDFYFQINEQKFLVEYDGLQHFEPIEYFGGHSGFKARKRRDAIKDEFAKKYGFILVRISYTDYDNIEAILKDKIGQVIHD